MNTVKMGIGYGQFKINTNMGNLYKYLIVGLYAILVDVNATFWEYPFGSTIFLLMCIVVIITEVRHRISIFVEV